MAKKSSVLKKKVLVVEDEILLLEMYKVAFEAGGFVVIGANNGEDGWRQLKKADIDMVLLDVKMDDVSGIEILRRLRSEPRLKKIPVWMLSNVGEEAVVQGAMSLGAEEYIMKTKIIPSQLVLMVKARLNKTHPLTRKSR